MMDLARHAAIGDAVLIWPMGENYPPFSGVVKGYDKEREGGPWFIIDTSEETLIVSPRLVSNLMSIIKRKNLVNLIPQTIGHA